MTSPRPTPAQQRAAQAAATLSELLGCKVTEFGKRGRGRHRCGRPVVANGLCGKHQADRIRLGGDP